jgi:hypothetical protein
VSPGAASARPRGIGVFWSLRVLETGLLLSALTGVGMFAWSLVDIVRIETDPAAAGGIPPTAWPGVFTFLGSMALLQVVRVFLHRYRRDDGSPRGDARGAAAAATAEVLASVPDVSDVPIVSEAVALAAEAEEEG